MRIRHLARFALHGEIKSHAALMLITVLAVSTLGAQSPNPVTIRAVDYAFQFPDTILAGPTLFTFENHGTVRHEVIISRLKEGHTFAEVMAAKTPAERNVALDGIIGILLSEGAKLHRVNYWSPSKRERVTFSSAP